MHKTRLEAFSDGVLAIIITIMVLELKVPHGNDLNAIVALLPVFLSYILSFINVGIYWNNHHHMLYPVDKINGKVMWANMHLLFWLSLIPFTAAWMGENHLAQLPVALYGLVLFMSAIAYTILSKILIAQAGKNSKLSQALGKDTKGKISILIYLIAIGLAFFNPIISLGLYATVAIIWFIPDLRIEHKLLSNEN